MKINTKLLSILLFAMFLGTIIPLTINLLAIYDKTQDPIQSYAFNALVYGVISVVLGALALLVMLTKTNPTKMQLTSSTDVSTEDKHLAEDNEDEQEFENDSFTISENEIKKIFKSNDNLTAAGEALLTLISKKIDLVQGILYTREDNSFVFKAGYAIHLSGKQNVIEEGEGIIGQTAKSMKQMLVNDIPDQDTTVISGLGSSKPKFILTSPIIHKKKTIAVLEIGTFIKMNSNFCKSLTEINSLLAHEILELKKNHDSA